MGIDSNTFSVPGGLERSRTATKLPAWNFTAIFSMPGTSFSSHGCFSACEWMLCAMSDWFSESWTAATSAEDAPAASGCGGISVNRCGGGGDGGRTFVSVVVDGGHDELAGQAHR